MPTRMPIRPLCVLAAGVAVGLMTSTGSRGAAADPLDARVAELERLVVRDPLRPTTAVLDRLAAVEKTLKLSGPDADLKTPDDLKQAVLRMSARQEELDRRIKAVEAQSKPAGVPASVDGAIRDLKQRQQDDHNAVRDLDSRVHRVESRF